MFLIILSFLFVTQNTSCKWQHEWEKTCFMLLKRARLVPQHSTQTGES